MSDQQVQNVQNYNITYTLTGEGNNFQLGEENNLMMNNQNVEVENMKKEILDLQGKMQENERKQEEVEAGLKERIDDLREEVCGLREENGDLREENGDLREEVGDLREKNGDLTDRVNMLEGGQRISRNKVILKLYLGGWGYIEDIEVDTDTTVEELEREIIDKYDGGCSRIYCICRVYDKGGKEKLYSIWRDDDKRLKLRHYDVRDGDVVMCW